MRYDLENGRYKYEEEQIKYSYSVNRNLLKTDDVVIKIYIGDEEYILRNATNNDFWKKSEFTSYHLMSHIISDKGYSEIDMNGILSKNLENLMIFYNDGSNAAFIPTQKDVNANDVLDYFKESQW